MGRAPRRGKVPHWQTLIDHVNRTWRRKKHSEFNYPFEGRDMRDLAHFARIYMAWGLMALWDAYLDSGGEWNERMGYSIPNFVRQLPRLVDSGWKVVATTYRRQMEIPIPREIAQLQIFGKHEKQAGKPT